MPDIQDQYFERTEISRLLLTFLAFSISSGITFSHLSRESWKIFRDFVCQNDE